jgi:16S rRNA (guanine966-N2)-methyltransferase
MLEALAYKRGFEPDEEEGDFAAARAWPRVLDLFAGSGGLGIEALSRGARTAEFVEQDREAARILASNLRATELEDRARIVQAPVKVAFGRLMVPFDVVFADPPYTDHAALEDAMTALSAAGVLESTSVVVVEQAWETQPPAMVGGLALASTRRHGRTRITLYASGDT